MWYVGHILKREMVVMLAGVQNIIQISLDRYRCMKQLGISPDSSRRYIYQANPELF
jgi:hypothetical protein